jgi:ATP-dependent helicase HepA
MKLGTLVTAENGLGVGKLVSAEGDLATIEYFESVAVRERLSIPLRSLKHVRLYPETRCYLQGDDGETWRVGRIGQLREHFYEVKFPNLEGSYVAESRLYVRCARPITDPMDILIHRAHETAYFSERRFLFVRALVKQRAATRGLSGLFSSRIELYAHQVEVVRRVLEDPVQRYLLADEVGLGKTIEAGAILRQFLLDDRIGRAVVLVPPLLKEQWISELGDKFGVFDFGERVEVRGTDEVELVAVDGTFRFVVIDEAHHVARLAQTSNSTEWKRFRTLAHASERLLLLSATPALHNEAAFLAMLHLLDPSVYQLDRLEAFRERVRRRQDMGRFLLAFNEGAPAFTLRRALGRVEDLFPSDPFLENTAERLRQALDEDDRINRDRAIRRIRTHVGETYRLHRRLLRNRRSSVEQVLTAGRAGERGSLVEEYDLDGRPERMHILLDDWRVAAFSAASELSDVDTASLRLVFLTLFETFGTWLGFFEDVVRTRLGEAVTDALRSSLSMEAISALQEVAHFPGEDSLLVAMLEVLAEPAEDGDRIELLRLTLESIRRAGHGQSSPKAVVFTSYPRVCKEIVSRLRQAWSPESVAMYGTGMSGEGVEREVRRFRDELDCAVLVCDRAGEEGRNLQFADWVIHFDLPFSPNRLEQRIGRLDRIGRVSIMQSRVFVGPEVENSMAEAWFQMLRVGIGVFRESIASLQFFLDAKLPELADALFRNGAQGLGYLLEPIREEIQQEQIRLSEQYALDEIDALESDAQSFFRDLDDFDADHARLQTATELWICDTLHFAKDAEFGAPHIVKYRPQRTRGATTLVPYDFLLSHLGAHIGRKGTYRRTVAAQTPGVTLYRVGEAFIDTMARYVEWDDRGRASAIWRYEPNWSPREGEEWTGFRFHYVASADTEPAQDVLRRSRLRGVAPEALRRRADALLPPSFETVWVGSDGSEVTDKRLLSVLSRPYRHPRDYGSDYNLHKHRIEMLDQVVDRGVWPRVCGDARPKSEALLRHDPSFQAQCAAQASRAERRFEHRMDQLRLRARLEGGGGVGEVAFEEELGEALIAGIRTPALRLDTVTFFVISGRNPFEFERSRY